MKKVFKWIGIAALTPILLFFILAVLLYLPPIQNWAAQKVAGIVSKNTNIDSVTLNDVVEIYSTITTDYDGQ